MALDPVSTGDPHVAAHNAERAAINSMETLVATHDTEIDKIVLGSYLSTENLDTIKNAGTYIQQVTSNGQVSNSYPINGTAGILEVLTLSISGTTHTVQRYTPWAAPGSSSVRAFYVRRQVSGTWGDWVEFSSSRTANGRVYQYDMGARVEREVLVTNNLLTTENLNDIQTPGIYYQNSAASGTLARNYPMATTSGSLEVLYNAATGVTQRYTPWSTSGLGTGPKGFWSRAKYDATWTPWYFYPHQRVDNTMGKAVYTWDPTTNSERLLYYNSGERRVYSTNAPTATEFTLSSDWTLSAGGYIALRRINDRVNLSIIGELTFVGSPSWTQKPILNEPLPEGWDSYYTQATIIANTPRHALRIGTGLGTRILGCQAPVANTSIFYAETSWTVRHPNNLPAGLPGLVSVPA